MLPRMFCTRNFFAVFFDGGSKIGVSLRGKCDLRHGPKVKLSGNERALYAPGFQKTNIKFFSFFDAPVLNAETSSQLLQCGVSAPYLGCFNTFRKKVQCVKHSFLLIGD